MAGFGTLFGAGSIGRQFLIYGVGYEVARSLLQPIFVAIEADQWSRAVSSSNGSIRVPLSPADLAQMAIRGVYTEEAAAPVAARSGVAPDDFAKLMLIAGEPPPLQLILELYRRGFIPWTAGPVPAISAENAIKEGRIRDEWIPVLQRAQFVPPSVADAVNGVVRNQISMQQGMALAYYAGLGVQSLEIPDGVDSTDTDLAFQILVDINGRPPAPGQLAELVHRGAIPVSGTGATTVSFEQGVFEGDLKDKWEKPLEALLTVIPALYEIRVLLEHGAISTEQAATWLEMTGYDATVSEALANDATSQAIVTEQQVTVSVVKTLFLGGAISDDDALTMLGNLGYTATAAKFFVAAWELQYELAALKSSISKVETDFVSHKLTPDQAQLALRRLGLPTTQVAVIMQALTVAEEANVKQLTATEVADAWAYQVFTTSQALGYLTGLGFTPYDAWVRLSVKNKGPLSTSPPPPQTSALTG